MEKRFGTTFVEILEEPIVRITWKGELQGDNLEAVVGWYLKQTESWAAVVQINDCSEVTGIPAEARKRAAGLPTERTRGTVMCGASFAIRTVGTLIVKVMNMGNKQDNPYAFVETREQAMEWAKKRAAELARERQKVSA
jgi:hypothetical protein